MNDLLLKRVSIHSDGAFGVLLADDIPFAVTLERTYPEGLSGQHVKIPVGRHLCTKSWYHRGGYWTFEIHVAGHSRILFHIGNIEDNSEGCVLVGEEFGLLNGKAAILRSGAAFKEFMHKLGDRDQFYLSISEV